jgi:hypothetical protein
MTAISKHLLVLSSKRRTNRSNKSSNSSSSSHTILRSLNVKVEVTTGKAAGEEVAATAKEEINKIRDTRARVIRDKRDPPEEVTQRTNTEEITKTIVTRRITVNKSIRTKATKEAHISLNSKIKYRMNLGKRAIDPGPQAEEDKVERAITNPIDRPKRTTKSAKVVKGESTSQRRTLAP